MGVGQGGDFERRPMAPKFLFLRGIRVYAVLNQRWFVLE